MSEFSRRLSRVFLLVHAAVAVGALWILPHGFPLTHSRFWLHSVLPVLGAITALGLIPWPKQGINLAMGFWFALSFSLCTWFGFEALLPAVLMFGLAVSCMVLLGPRAPGREDPFDPWMSAGVAVALFVTWAAEAPSPSTTPTSHPVEMPKFAGALSMNSGPLFVSFDATLSVQDASRTGFQTRFSGADPYPIPNTMYGTQTETMTRLHGVSEVPRDVWAHLSSVLVLSVTGHQALEVEFSPCPGTRFPVEWAEYPWGAPVKFATVTADRRFVVARARTGEKGPYTSLCEGKLLPEDPLVLTLFDEGVPRFRVTAHDYAAQLSTELSPAAGWGIPQNAVQFSLAAAPRKSGAFFHFTLASTGVGIGWDSVGILPGTYANRVDIERL